jgi:hypothetical protein
MRPNLGLPDGVRICTPDLSNCSFLPRVNQPFTLAWTVCNNGSGTASASTTRVFASLNNAAGQGDFALPALAPNTCSFQQLAEPLTASFEQDVAFTVVADSKNEVAERFEDDNWGSVNDRIWF